MGRIRAALLGALISVPAALVLPAAMPAAAASCSGMGNPTINSVQATNGQPAYGPAGSTVVIQGNNFGSSNGSVTFSGSQTAASIISWSNTAIEVQSPSDAVTGPVTVCGTQVLVSGPTTSTQSYYYPPKVNGYSPGAASEGQAFTINGQNFVAGASATMSGCSVGVAVSSQTALSAHVPGYQCSGTISVTEPVPGSSPALTQSGSGPGFTVTPTIGNPSATGAVYGQTITVNGSGFGSSGAVTLGGAPATPTNWSDSSVSLQVPDGTDGGAVTVYTAGGAVTTSQGVGVQPTIIGAGPNPIHEGDILTITGHNLGDPSQAGTVNMGNLALNPTGWSWSRVTAEVPTPATPGPILLTRKADGAISTTGPSVNIQPQITGVDPPSAAPGGFVTISGTGFSQNPAVSIGGKAATVALGGDNSIAVTVPNGATSGNLVVTSSYGQAVTWGQTFTVLAGSSSNRGGSGGSSYGGGPIYIQPNYGFIKLPPPPPAISFHITTPSISVKPGSTVPLTVTLQLQGKPVAGSPIKLEIFKSPGSDDSLSALSGNTDQNGQLVVHLKLSKKAGQTIVIANSTTFGDSLTINTLSAASGSLLPRSLISNSSLDPHILIPFAGALVVAVLLLLGAVFLQWRLHRRALVPAAPAAKPEDAAAVEAVVAATVVKRPRAPRAPRAPRKSKPAPATEPQPVEEVVAETLARAVGAENVSAEPAPEMIAPVIQLRKPRGAGGISRGRGPSKPGE